MDPRDLKKVGLKNTLPRKLILDLLEKNQQQRHLSAEETYRLLHDQGEHIGIATIYRVLAQFEAAGLVERHQFEGNTAVFELKEEQHHDHLVCVDCGAIIEFVNEEIELQQQKVAAREGFEITGHALYLYGKCKDREHCPRRRRQQEEEGE